MKNIQFRPVKNNFLAKLKNDVKDINNRNELLVHADKSTGIYKFLYKNEILMIDYNKCKKQDHKKGFPHTL